MAGGGGVQVLFQTLSCYSGCVAVIVNIIYYNNNNNYYYYYYYYNL